jgi:hypothetical protein
MPMLCERRGYPNDRTGRRASTGFHEGTRIRSLKCCAAMMVRSLGLESRAWSGPARRARSRSLVSQIADGSNTLPQTFRVVSCGLMQKGISIRLDGLHK